MTQIELTKLIHELSWSYYKRHPKDTAVVDGVEYDDVEIPCLWSDEVFIVKFEVRIVGGGRYHKAAEGRVADARAARARDTVSILAEISEKASKTSIETLFKGEPVILNTFWNHYREGTLRAYAQLARASLHAPAHVQARRVRYLNKAADHLIRYMKIPTLTVERAFDGYIPQGKRT